MVSKFEDQFRKLGSGALRNLNLPRYRSSRSPAKVTHFFLSPLCLVLWEPLANRSGRVRLAADVHFPRQRFWFGLVFRWRNVGLQIFCRFHVTTISTRGTAVYASQMQEILRFLSVIQKLSNKMILCITYYWF